MTELSDLAQQTPPEPSETDVHTASDLWDSYDPDRDTTTDMVDRIATALAQARRQENEACAQIADEHGAFCHKEAHHGGSHDLYERASGAAHIAQLIRSRQGGQQDG